MQITLVETEIKQAITDYVSNQLTINEGMEISVDLRATRGEAGYQAFITISPAEAPKTPRKAAAPKAAPEEPKDTKAPLGIIKAVEEAKAEPKTKAKAIADTKIVSEVVEEPAAAPEPEAVVETAEEPAAEEPKAAEPEAVAPAPEPTGNDKVKSLFASKTNPEPEAPKGEPKSLFGGLSRPNQFLMRGFQVTVISVLTIAVVGAILLPLIITIAPYVMGFVFILAIAQLLIRQFLGSGAEKDETHSPSETRPGRDE